MAMHTLFFTKLKTYNYEENITSVNICYWGGICSTSLHAQDDVQVIFDEDFSEFTNGSEEQPGTEDISEGLFTNKLSQALPGWSGELVYEAGGMLKIGDTGNLATDRIGSVTAKKIKVSFDVRSLADYGGAYKVTIGSSYGSSGDASKTEFIYDDEWKHVSHVFTTTSYWSSTYVVKFEPYMASDGILIDNVKVEASDAFVSTPEALQPTKADGTSFTARWTEVDGATSYLLDVYDGEKNYLLQDMEVTGTSYDVTGLTEGKTYYFTVRAKVDGNVSEYSNEIEVVEVISELPAPKALPATDVTAAGFTANWEAVDKASQYLVTLNCTKVLAADEDVNVLVDDFSKVDVGTISSPDLSLYGGALDEYTNLPGWDSYMPCFASGCLGIYPFGNGGYIVTPKLDLSNNGGAFTLTVNLAENSFGTYKSGGTVEFRVYNGKGGEPVETKTVTTEEGFTDYTLTFTKGSADTYVEIYYNGGNKLFIEDVAISQTLKAGDSYSYVYAEKEVSDGTSCKFDAPIDENTSYSYTVKAYARTVIDGEIDMLASEASAPVTVDITSTGINSVDAAGETRVYAVDGGVVVELDADATIRVYTVSGQQVAVVAGHAGTNRIATPSGLVIVNADGSSRKVMVK